jgi:hypothetical protein
VIPLLCHVSTNNKNYLVLKRTDFNAIEKNTEITKQRSEHWQSRSRMNMNVRL